MRLQLRLSAAAHHFIFEHILIRSQQNIMMDYSLFQSLNLFGLFQMRYYKLTIFLGEFAMEVIEIVSQCIL